MWHMIYVYYEKKWCRFNKKICNFNEKIIYFYDITSCFTRNYVFLTRKHFVITKKKKKKKKRTKQLQSANVWMMYICCFKSLHVTRASHVRRSPVRFYLWRDVFDTDGLIIDFGCSARSVILTEAMRVTWAKHRIQKRRVAYKITYSPVNLMKTHPKLRRKEKYNSLLH